MEILNNTYLKFIDFNELSLWDVKRLFLSSVKSKYKIVSLRGVIKERSEKVNLYDFHDEKFWILWVNNKEWIFDAYEEIWKNINQSYKKVYLWDLAYNPYRVNVWSVWMKIEKHKFDYISPAYVVFYCNKSQLLPEYFYILFKSDLFNWLVNENTTWSVRQNLKFSTLKEIKIPLPSLEEQNRIVQEYNAKIKNSLNAEIKAQILEKEIESFLIEELGIEVREKEEKKIGLRFVDYKKIKEWWIDKINIFNLFTSNKNKIVSLADNSDFYLDIKRWKSPEYSGKWNKIILNQKCNRWDEIDLQFWKTVDENWLKWIDNNLLTQTWDILINSTWEGTIWRASLIREWFEWLLYDSHLLLLRLNQSIINPDFFVMFFNNNLWQNQVNNIKSAQATKQTELWVWNLLKIYFPLSKIEVQEKIVKHIWDLKEEIKSLKKLSDILKESAKVEFEKEIFS